MWLINRKNPLSSKEEITFSDVRNQRLILYNEEYMTYHNVMECCKQEGFTPNVIHFIAEAIMAYKYCSKYNALAITVDYIAQDIEAKEIVVRPIDDIRCLWSLYFIRKAGVEPSRAQKAFAGYLLGLMPKAQSTSKAPLK